MQLDSKTAAFLLGLVSAAFGAGGTFSLWASSHPSETAIAIALGCSGPLEACPAAKDAREARADTMRIQGEIKDLRKDLSRGFGRCLVPNIYVRDEGGKAALRMFESEISQGVPPVVAFRHVVEGDFP